MPQPQTTTREEHDLQVSADVTYKQFLAIATYFRHFNPIDDLLGMTYFQNLNRCRLYSRHSVRKWLFNAWNTERILRFNSDLLQEDNNYFILQWSFPQIYYSAFSSTLAYFKTVGYTEESHTNVMKKFALLVTEDKYPNSIKFSCSGRKDAIIYHSIAFTDTPNAMELNIFDIESVMNKICQFLKTTRKIQIDEKRNDTNVKKKFKTSNGQIKSRLTSYDWDEVSKMIGHTTLLNLLYRKRIKANYRDIDTFNFEGIRSYQINKCLVNIINTFNLIHEAMIYKSLGFDEYNTIYEAYIRGNNIKFLSRRYEIINNNI